MTEPKVTKHILNQSCGGVGSNSVNVWCLEKQVENGEEGITKLWVSVKVMHR